MKQTEPPIKTSVKKCAPHIMRVSATIIVYTVGIVQHNIFEVLFEYLSKTDGKQIRQNNDAAAQV